MFPDGCPYTDHRQRVGTRKSAPVTEGLLPSPRQYTSLADSPRCTGPCSDELGENSRSSSESATHLRTEKRVALALCCLSANLDRRLRGCFSALPCRTHSGCWAGRVAFHEGYSLSAQAERMRSRVAQLPPRDNTQRLTYAQYSTEPDNKDSMPLCSTRLSGVA